MSYFDDFDPNAMINTLTANKAAAEVHEARDLDDILKLNRKGQPVIGKDDKVDPETFAMIVNPQTFMSGWRCWLKNQDNTTKDVPIVAKLMQEMPEGGIPRPEPIQTWRQNQETKAMEQGPCEWKPYHEFKGIVIAHSVGDIGRVVTFAGDSGWAKAFFDTLFSRTHARAEAARDGRVPPFICPVIMIGTKDVKATYAFTKMTFEIVDWADKPLLPQDANNPQGSRILSQLKAMEAPGQEQLAAPKDAVVESVEEEEEASKKPRRKPAASKG